MGTFVKVAEQGGIAENSGKLVEVEGREIALIRSGDEYYALAARGASGRFRRCGRERRCRVASRIAMARGLGAATAEANAFGAPKTAA